MVYPSVFILGNGSEQEHFCLPRISLEQNYEVSSAFHLLLNGLEWNSEIFLSFEELFGTKLQTSECFSLLRNGSERNSELF
jgi:hypothetical protein